MRQRCSGRAARRQERRARGEHSQEGRDILWSGNPAEAVAGERGWRPANGNVLESQGVPDRKRRQRIVTRTYRWTANFCWHYPTYKGGFEDRTGNLLVDSGMAGRRGPMLAGDAHALLSGRRTRRSDVSRSDEERKTVVTRREERMACTDGGSRERTRSGGRHGRGK